MCSSTVRSIMGLRRIASLPVNLPVASTGVWGARVTWHNKAAFISLSRRNDILSSSLQFCTVADKAASGEAPPPPSPEELEVKRLGEEVAAEKKKNSELQDKYMRALAENQNTITRMRKQVDDAKVYGVQSLVKDLLEFSDVLHSALESIPKEEVTEKNIHLKNLHVGLSMVSSSLEKVFKKYGVETIDPLGEKFNPNFHEALFQQEVENKSAGTIVAVSKVGFKLSDRVIRPALVGVAK